MKTIRVFFLNRFWFKKTKILPKDRLGIDGENFAAKFLKKNGYHVIARNVHFMIGEIDIIAQTGTTIVFVEVKTRRDASYCHPIEAVDRKKKQKIKRMGYQYFYRNKYDPARYSIRFDIITLIWPKEKMPKVEHFPGAF